MPLWESALFAELEQAAKRFPEATAIIPTFAGKRGHPVLLSPRALLEVRGLDARRDRLDLWLHAQKVEEVPVASPRVLENWNEAVA